MFNYKYSELLVRLKNYLCKSSGFQYVSCICCEIRSLTSARSRRSPESEVRRGRGFRGRPRLLYKGARAAARVEIEQLEKSASVEPKIQRYLHRAAAGETRVCGSADELAGEILSQSDALAAFTRFVVFGSR